MAGTKTKKMDGSCQSGLSKGSATREAIVAEALRQATRVGLEGVSMAPLAASLKLSKSGLFAHFKSKEALQLEVVESAIDRFRREVVARTEGENDSEKRLRELFGRYLRWIRGTKKDGGCLFLTIAQEYDDRPGRVRELLVKSQLDWRAYIAGLVREGMAEGTFAADVDAEQAVFEFLAVAFSYQQAAKLLQDPRADERSALALDRLINSLKQ